MEDDGSLPVFAWALDGIHMGCIRVQCGKMDAIWAVCGHARSLPVEGPVLLSRP